MAIGLFPIWEMGNVPIDCQSAAVGTLPMCFAAVAG
jgi:hypothetical protein